MNPRRSKRGWLAGLFAGVAAVGTVLGLQALFEIVDRALRPPQAFGPGTKWYDILLYRMEYLGHDPLGLVEAKSSHAVGMLLALGALFVVTMIGTWWAARGTAPGSSVFPIFLSAWASFIIAATIGRLVQAAWNLRDSFDQDGLANYLVDSAIRTGADFGLVWGFPAALLTALFWLVVRPKPAPQPAGVPPGQPQEPLPDQFRQDDEPRWATTVEDPPYDPARDTRPAPGSQADSETGEGPDLNKRAD